MGFAEDVLHHPEIVEQLRFSQYIVATGFVVLIYDHLLTFGDEVQLIWKGKPSLPRTLFLLQRYVPLFSLAFNAFATSGHRWLSLSDDFCRGHFIMVVIIGFFSLANSQFLVLLRLWVIWDRDKELIIWTLLGFIISQAGTLIALSFNFRTLYRTSYFEPLLHSCYWHFKVKQWPQWIPSLAFEILVFLATVYNRLSRPHRTDKEMSQQLYRDGSLYFGVLLLLRLIHLVTAAKAPTSLMFTTFFAWAFANITATRLILNCRRLAMERAEKEQLLRDGIPGDAIEEVEVLSFNNSPRVLRSDGGHVDDFPEYGQQRVLELYSRVLSLFFMEAVLNQRQALIPNALKVNREQRHVRNTGRSNLYTEPSPSYNVPVPAVAYPLFLMPSNESSSSSISNLDENLAYLSVSDVRLSSDAVQFLWNEGADVDAIKSQPVLRPQLVDPSQPLTAYFISSSHNTYLLSKQLMGKSSADAYHLALSTGASCVEMDVWSLSSFSSMFNSSSTSTPSSKSGLVVTHGYTLSEAVSLESVVIAVKDAMDGAEASSGGQKCWPVFVSLECHVPVQEQGNLVDVMKGAWGDRLVLSPPSDDGSTVSPQMFMGKILVMVEYYPPEDEGSDSSSSDENSSNQPQKPPHPKINDALASIGYFARSMKPREGWLEKTFPLDAPKNILINISESGLRSLLPHSLEALVSHSHQNLRRIFPKGTRITSGNLDPTDFWASGAQVVSLNWQKFDRGMQLNKAMFAGSSGWVLKPPFMRPNHSRPAVSKKVLTLRIAGISCLEPPKDCREPGESYHAYVVAQLFRPTVPSPLKEIKVKTKSKKTKTSKEQRSDISWNETLELPYEVEKEGEEQLVFLRLRVKEDEIGKDDVLSVWCARVDLLIMQNDTEEDSKTRGWRLLRMLDLEGKWTGTTLLIKLEVREG